MSQLIPIQCVEIVSDNFCRHCGSRVESQDNFCSRCGSETACRSMTANGLQAKGTVSVPSNAAEVAASSEIMQLLNNRAIVIGMLALVGPLGLPALWFSPRFSKTTKIVATTLFLILTIVAPLALAWYWLEYSIRPFVDAFPLAG